MLVKHLLAWSQALIRHLGINSHSFLSGFLHPMSVCALISSFFGNLIFNYSRSFSDKDGAHLSLGTEHVCFSRRDNEGSGRATWESGCGIAPPAQ